MHGFEHDLIIPLGWLALVALILFLGYQLDKLGGGIAGPIMRANEQAEREAKERAEYQRLRAKFEPQAEAALEAEVTRPVRPGVRQRLSTLAGERATV